ncbi:MAG: UDP-glucose dehydrogenase family protein [Candidatus Woesearchaeota archaeon]
MKIAVFGTGYVGLTVGTCFSNLGNDVVCVDIDKEKVENLKKGIIPIYEPGLSEMVVRNHEEGRLIFTLNAEKAVKENDIIFIGVGTPQDETGKADLRFIEAVAETIGKNMDSYKVVVTKSTVPVGTNHKVKKIIKKFYKGDFDVVSNPEFLKEGSAVRDFLSPDRVVIGVESEKAEKIMRTLYKDIERINRPVVVTDVKSAELIKYASNSFLAMKISFMNEIANLSERVGADVKEIIKGVGLDTRIGFRFLQPGVGYGGSCFPKDLRALIKTGEFHGCDFFLLEAAEKVNRKQKISVIPKAEKMLGDFEGKTVAVLGLAFKPKTDDMREAPAIDIINNLLERGADVRTFDPTAMENAKKIFGNKIYYAKNPYDTLEGADCMILATEWDEFRALDRRKIKKLMKKPYVVDGRNIYDKDAFLKDGFRYAGVGR